MLVVTGVALSRQASPPSLGAFELGHRLAKRTSLQANLARSRTSSVLSRGSPFDIEAVSYLLLVLYV